MHEQLENLSGNTGTIVLVGDVLFLVIRAFYGIINIIKERHKELNSNWNTMTWKGTDICLRKEYREIPVDSDCSKLKKIKLSDIQEQLHRHMAPTIFTPEQASQAVYKQHFQVWRTGEWAKNGSHILLEYSQCQPQ